MSVRRSRFIERSVMGALSFIKDSVFADEYASKKGFLQRRDPRVKALMIFLLVLTVLFTKSIFLVIGIYLLCLLLAFVSGVHLGFFLKRTWFFIPIFSLCIALPALFSIFSPGETLVRFKIFSIDLNVTRQGVAGAAIFFLRVLTSVSLCVLLSLTTRHYALLRVLHVFKVPQVFVMTLGMCYRYIYLFIEIIQNTYTAIRSRTQHILSTKRGQKMVAWNIAHLWQRSYALHQDVYHAMLSRGYDGEIRVLYEFCVTIEDLFWLAVVTVLFIGSLWQTYFLS